MQHGVIAIHRAHTDEGFLSPAKDRLVKRTMQGIRRTLGTKQRRLTALVKDDLLEMAVHIEQQLPGRAARGKALMLIGFAGAFRRSEFVALTMNDITTYDKGIELAIWRSKNDQEGSRRTVFIPYALGKRCLVKALQDWIDAAGIVAGPLFLKVSRHDSILGTKSLTPQSVALLVKCYVRKFRGDEVAKQVAAHSLRAGYCTEVATAGLQPYQIREQTGLTLDVTLARYIRPVSKRKIPSLL